MKKTKPTITEAKVRESISSLIRTVMKEMMNEAVKSYVIDMPPYSMQLTSDNMVLFSKNGKMFKSVDVKPSFDKRDFIKLAKLYAGKFNVDIKTDLNRL